GGRTGRDGHPTLHGGTRADLEEPSLEVWELLEILTLPLPTHRPGIRNHVGNRVLVAREITPIVEPIVEHAVQPIHFVGEATHGVALIALRLAQPTEVAALPGLRSLIGHLPHHPLRDLVLRTRRLWPEFPELLGDVHHDRTGFEHADRLTAADGRVIDQRRHPVVRA